MADDRKEKVCGNRAEHVLPRSRRDLLHANHVLGWRAGAQETLPQFSLRRSSNALRYSGSNRRQLRVSRIRKRLEIVDRNPRRVPDLGRQRLDRERVHAPSEQARSDGILRIEQALPSSRHIEWP